MTWKGWAEVFRLSANMYFKRIVLAKLSKSFNKNLFELGTGGVDINLRPLERSLTSSFERAWLERFLIYLSFWALVFWVKSLLRLFRLREHFLLFVGMYCLESEKDKSILIAFTDSLN